MSSTKAKLKAKIVAVGDGMAGKTCMIIAYAHNYFPNDCVPTVFEMYSKTIKVGRKNFDVHLWDTAGQESYDILRLLTYCDTQCFLVCFSLVNRTSYDNVTQRWIPEIKHFCPDVPLVLVGTKSDIRSDRNPYHITLREGRKLKSTIKADTYVECSAKERENLDRVFEAAIRAHVKATNPSRFFPCSIV